MRLPSNPLAIASAAVAAVALAAPAAAIACGAAGYTYAGVQAKRATYGVGARLTATTLPFVEAGHVAGWVGVGGVGLGPNGTNAWIQVGFSAFPGSTTSNLYYEVARPGQPPVYKEIASALPSGLTRSVAVLEMAHRRNSWRVWVNGTPASPPVYLPGSHGAWRPVATAESWGGGSRVCNKFSYYFQSVNVARVPGGGWHRLNSTYTINTPGYRLIRTAAASFLATSRTAEDRDTTANP